jgi:carbonic anhydrase/acetyltransferase-like protein (isoleucine patch superfamily)
MRADVLRLKLLVARNRGGLSAAPGVRVGRGARVRVAAGATVELAPGVALGAGSRIEAAGGRVSLGPGARLGERAVIVARAGVDVGERAVVGDWAAVADAAPAYADPETPVRRQPLRAAPLTIGAGARIGPHAAVHDSLPAGADVAPYAVVERTADSAS